MAELGPRMKKLKVKELSSIRGIRYKNPESINYEDFENASPVEKVKILDIRPDIALGKSAGKEFQQVQLRIYFIILSSLIVAILGTVAYSSFDDDSNKKEYLVAASSISWFLFISFIFLLFNATRLLHIVLFIIIIILFSMVYDFLDKNNKLEKTRNIILAAEVFIAFVIIILLYYYLTSRKEDELIELKDAQNLRNFNNYTKDLVTKARELERSKVVKELEKKYEAKELQRENAKKLKLKKSERSSPTKKEDD